MKRYYRIASTVLSAALLLTGLSSCTTNNAEWDDSLPSPLANSSSPSVIYETEPTTTTEPITVTTPPKTARTAFSSKGPELATTTATYPEETEDSDRISIVSDVPKVPVAEYTSTTAEHPTAATRASSSSSDSYGNLLETNQDDIYAVVGDDGTVTGTANASGLFSPVSGKDTIVRPYSYNSLNDKYLYIYDALVTAIDQRKSSVQFSSVMSISADDYCAVYQQLYNDENAMFYLDTKMQYATNVNTQNVTSANLFYKYSDSEIIRMQNAIDSEVNRILSKITSDMTDYDIVKLFYDYLAENVVYVDDTENCRDLYGVFAEKKALCGGYAKAFSYLCGKVGIENLTITGDADNVPHMWNMVKLEGEWYHIDPTYAVTESALGSYVRYDYFCVTDDVISRTRTVYAQDYRYPKATAKTCNYYVKNGLVADSWEDVTAMLMNQILLASRNKSLVAQIQCSNKDTYDVAVYRLFDRTQAQAITLMQDALELAANKYKCDNISYSQDNGTYVIKLFLEYT